MNTCSSCKFWSKHENNKFGSCSRWLKGYSISVDDLASNEVLVEDDEGWGAEVGCNFGCILWISK